MNYVKSFNLFGVEAKEIPCITGKGVPSSVTPGDVGCLYMDTNTGDIYKCTAVTNGVYTWTSDAVEINATLAEHGTSIQELTDNLALVNARINNLASLEEGSTTGDAELADIRVGYNGFVYTNAGEAVRQQVGGLADDIALPVLPISEWVDGTYLTFRTGKLYNRATTTTSNFIEIPNEVKKVRVVANNDGDSCGVCFYSEAKIAAYISGNRMHDTTKTLVELVLDVPDGANYIRFTTLITLKDKSYIQMVGLGNFAVETYNAVKSVEESVSNLEESVNALKSIPDYYAETIEEAKAKIMDEAELGSTVIGLYTDIHCPTDAFTNIRHAQLQILNKLANESIIDFTIGGGDLLTYGTVAGDCKHLNNALTAFSLCRVPHFIAKGDHDSAQTDGKITREEWQKRTYPYMKGIVPSLHIPNNYYYDLPDKNVRFIHIDTGTAKSGQGDSETANDLFDWLIDEVFTDDVKDGWEFVIFTHAPIDWEWNIGMARRAIQGHGGLTYALYKYPVICRLFDCINGATAFNTLADMVNPRTFYVDSDGVLCTESEAATTESYTVVTFDYEKTKDFSNWTSKVRICMSGHVHCDRLTNFTNGHPTSWVQAYTGAANPGGFKSEETYYLPVFGAEGRVATWSDLQDRTIGTVNESLIDVLIVNPTNVKRIRIGAGTDKTLEL